MINPGTYTIRAAEQVVELVVEPPPPVDLAEALQASRAGEETAPFRITLFNTGINSGPIRLSVSVLSARVEETLEGWEDVHEFSATLPAGHVAAAGPMEDLTPLGELSDGEAGDFRVRVSANGRDLAADLTPETAVEDYWVQIWQESISPSKVLAARSDQGKYWAIRLE